MDFVKVFEQTVRDLKREVNLKVLKIPEIEQKVLDATDEEPWGPHGSALAEIAQATKKFSECQMVMNVLWTRLTETGKNWRLVYKALTVIEYLVAHGSERAVDEIVEHTFQISSLASFEYVEPSGKDLGINVRKKAETIVSLLNDKDKIQEVRNKAATNRDKYFGLSSTGITYKSGTASFSSSNSRISGQYGGFGDKGDRDSSKDSYDYDEEKYEKPFKSKTEPPRYGSMEKTSSASGMPGKLKSAKKPEKRTSVISANVSGNKYDEDIDDFDPRGSSSSKPPGNPQTGPSFPDIDLFGEPLAAPTGKPASENPSDVDLFADANFVSATPETGVDKHVLQSNADLFASHPIPPVSTTVDFFATLNPVTHPETSAQPTPVDLFATPDPVSQPDSIASTKSDKTSSIVDPFASFPLNNFDGADSFGSFTSNTYPSVTQPDRNSQSEEFLSETKSTPAAPPKKGTFQMKSGIWADSLSRGLIDLNITAPKKANLTEVGIVGGLTDGSGDKDKGPLPSFYMGGATGSGYGTNRPGFTSASGASSGSTMDDFFSSLSDHQNQFGSFQK